MNRITTLSFAVVALVACSREDATPPWSHAPAAAAPAPTGASSAAMPAQAAYDLLDQRTPIPLLPMMANRQKANMRDHLVAVQEIMAALAKDDLAAVATAAGKMGFSDQMGQMCQHMGMAAPGFTDQALGFHRQADKVAVAARAGDKAAVVTELNTTLTTCTGCHARWKQQVVDEATWTRLTGSPSPMGAGMPMRGMDHMQHMQH